MQCAQLAQLKLLSRGKKGNLGQARNRRLTLTLTVTLVRSHIPLSRPVAVSSAQHTMARERAGLLSPLDRMSDDLLLRILVAAAADDTEQSEGFASLNQLCQLRTVCSRFDKIIPDAGKLVCTELISNFEGYQVAVLRFLQQKQAVKSLDLTVKVSQLFLEALSGAAPHLESIQISHGFSESDLRLTPEDGNLEIFKAMSMCRSLNTLRIECRPDSDVNFYGRLASRYSLKALKSLVMSEIRLDEDFVASIALAHAWKV